MSQNVPPETALEAVADALIEAHVRATEDGDQLLLNEIEELLLYVGRRLAQASDIGNGTLNYDR